MTRNGSWRAVALALALALLAAGCGRNPAGAEREGPAALAVRFGGPQTTVVPSGLDSLVFSVYAPSGAGERLVASQNILVRPGESSGDFAVELRVPLATGYRIRGAAYGSRDRASFPAPAAQGPGPRPLGTNFSLYGIHFHASRRIDATLGGATAIDLTLADVVPRGSRFIGQFGDSLSWAPVPSALGYRVRGYFFSGAPATEYRTTGTTLFVPTGQGADYYRGASELDGGDLSAFSEIF